MLRLITSVTLASGGATAAFLAMGVAAADPDATTVTVPDPFGVTFVAPRMATASTLTTSSSSNLETTMPLENGW